MPYDDLLVSAIMPTRGRPEFAARALLCCRWQTYPHKELIILDDADDPSFPRGVSEPGIIYLREFRRLSIGAKRNKCCALAAGEIICCWDDDDFSAPERMADQVKRLRESGAQVTGYHSMRFTHGREELWEWTGEPDYAIGTSLMFRREFWEENQFPDMQVQEDYKMVMAGRRAKSIVSAHAGNLLIATIHDGNTAKRLIHKEENWRRIA